MLQRRDLPRRIWSGLPVGVFISRRLDGRMDFCCFSFPSISFPCLARMAHLVHVNAVRMAHQRSSDSFLLTLGFGLWGMGIVYVWGIRPGYWAWGLGFGLCM